MSSLQDEDEKEHRETILQFIHAECELNSLQYVREKDANKYWVLEKEIWPMAVSVAELQCAKVILFIDEKKHIGKLSFTGQEIMKTHLDTRTTTLGKLLLDYSDTYFVSIQDGMLQIQFLFELYEETKVADYSAEIINIRQLRHQENLRYWRLIDKGMDESRNKHNSEFL